jgi:tetratricopeptide (TPR) repeat protein
MPTLEHIARRTGKPVEFFLAEPVGATDTFQARLLELEALVADSRNQEAITLGNSLLDTASSAFRLGRIRLLLGQAHLGAHQVERATPLLADARAYFEGVSDLLSLAECIGAQATAANTTQAKDAVFLAETALSVCRRLTPSPASTEARLLGVLAEAHAANHDWDRAVVAYESAIELGGPVAEVRNAARAYARLGAAYREADDVETAARYTSRSVALLELFRDRDALAKAEHDLALVLMKRGDMPGARRHLQRALQLCSEFDLGCGRTLVLLGLSELSMREGEIERARELAAEALELAERIEEAASIAEAHMALGRIADRQEDPTEADRRFEDAISGFAALGMRERLLQCHGAYAEILERRGELGRAYEHMKEALQASRPGALRKEQAKERLSSA